MKIKLLQEFEKIKNEFEKIKNFSRIKIKINKFNKKIYLWIDSEDNNDKIIGYAIIICKDLKQKNNDIEKEKMPQWFKEWTENDFKPFKKEINHKISNIEKDISILKENQAIIKKDISILKENQAIIKKDISTLQKDVITLKENQAIIKKDIITLKENQTIMKKDISTLQKDVELIKNCPTIKRELQKLLVN